MKKENWLPVPGYEGLYSVSDLGNIMSMNYANTGMLKILKPINRKGYLRVDLYKDKNVRSHSIHRLVMLAFIGVSNGMPVNHKSGVKTENSLSNLEYCTHSENSLHSFRIGLQSNIGEKHSRAKLTESNVISIKERISKGEKHASIAKDFSVCTPTISKISSGSLWSHVVIDRKVG